MQKPIGTTKCNDYYFNETDKVCKGKGKCISPQTCSCDSQFDYGDECENSSLIVYIVVPIGSIVGIIIVLVFLLLIGLSIFIILNKNKKLKLLDGIEDAGVVLQEIKLEQQQTKNGNAKIKVNKELFQINSKDIKLLSLIGEGSSESSVFLVDWMGKECAFKKFIFKDSEDYEQFEEFEKEVEIFSSINHPNILQFFGACITPPHIGILLA